MAYYAAVISLKQTIQRLLDSSRISILTPSLQILELAFDKVTSFQGFLRKNERKIINNISNGRMKSLNGEIREVAYKLEDALESHVLNQYEIHEGSSQELFLNLEEVKEEINSFVETMKKIEKMMMEEFSKPLPEEDDEDIPSKIDFGGNSSKMVGLSEEFRSLKDQLVNDLLSRRNVVSILGMAGIGKTALAMKLFEDPSISSHFDTRVFVTVGPKLKYEKVILSILAQMNHNIDKMRMEPYMDDLIKICHQSLQNKRYLVVLDDVWNIQDLENLMVLLPGENSRSRILLTTRLERVAQCTANRNLVHRIRFLSKKESWDLLREKVFGEVYLCPFELHKFGKKIAENCEGLPLTIITVANILSKEEKTPEFWEKVAEKENSVFTDAYDQMYEILISSYIYLPQYLKPCFLYMGVFPQSCKIPASKLIKLWRAEQFLDAYSLREFEDFAKECLRGLVSKSIILVNHWSSGYGTYVKTCSLHSVYWHICAKEARDEKFFHVINRYASSFIEGIKSQRRLCIHKNVLFGIKKVHNSIESISMARSLLCTGPHHQYPVPICFGLSLLHVLDALTIRFYRFPIEVLKLVQLRYLALTYSGEVPGSISKLWNLEHLIVHRHLSIKTSSEDSLYLPAEIWCMKELRHIQVLGSNLADSCGGLLRNLLTLSGVSVNSCSKEILKRTPNLKKLGIQIELSLDVVEPFFCFDHLSHLRYLESLKCVIVNPQPSSRVFASITTFPSHLMKLSLSGLGYPWEYMRTIAKMPKLEVLKLRCYAFQGPVWETYEGEFLSLEYLLLEDTDVEYWRGDGIHCFPFLQRLIIRHCYKLKGIPSSLGGKCKPEFVKLVDCPSLGVSEKQLQEEYRFSNISVHSSLDDEK